MTFLNCFELSTTMTSQHGTKLILLLVEMYIVFKAKTIFLTSRVLGIEQIKI